MRARYATFLLPLFIALACGSTNDKFGNDGGKDGSFGDGGPTFGDTGVGDGSLTLATCADAAKAKSYVGCDYWPTITGNNVWSIFDFAVVVANASGQPAQITITGPNATNQTATVAAGQLQKFYLPWVTSLKGPDADGDGTATPMTGSV